MYRRDGLDVIFFGQTLPSICQRVDVALDEVNDFSLRIIQISHDDPLRPQRRLSFLPLLVCKLLFIDESDVSIVRLRLNDIFHRVVGVGLVKLGQREIVLRLWTLARLLLITLDERFAGHALLVQFLYELRSVHAFESLFHVSSLRIVCILRRVELVGHLSRRRILRLIVDMLFGQTIAFIRLFDLLSELGAGLQAE